MKSEITLTELKKIAEGGGAHVCMPSGDMLALIDDLIAAREVLDAIDGGLAMCDCGQIASEALAAQKVPNE